MRTALLTLLLILIAMGTGQGVGQGWEEEVAHLLGFIERSDCTFIRNGKNYDSIQARAHIQKKFDYLKNKIDSAEQFIVYSATKSSITRMEYGVSCDGVALSSREWLETELNRYRQEKR